MKARFRLGDRVGSSRPEAYDPEAGLTAGIAPMPTQRKTWTNVHIELKWTAARLTLPKVTSVRTEERLDLSELAFLTTALPDALPIHLSMGLELRCTDGRFQLHGGPDVLP